MKNTEMIYMEEVLELAHHKMGYGKDDLSKEIFHVLIENENNHYLIKSKKMREYIEKYIDRKYREINGRLPISYEEEDTIIKIEGSTKGMKYNRYGILKMLEDEHVNKLLINRLKESGTFYNEEYLPSELVVYKKALDSEVIQNYIQLQFFDLIKSDSEFELIELKKLIERSLEMTMSNEESIKEMIKEENKGIVDELDYTLGEVLDYSKFENIIEFEKELESNYWYLSSKEILEIEKSIEKIVAMT